MNLTSKAIMENNNHNPMPLQANPMGLYPETTISPMSGPTGHMQPMALKTVIKQEPIPYIKREVENNNQHLMQQLHPPPPHMLNDGGYLHGTPGASPISSLSSPGSPPNRGPYALPGPPPQLHMGGGKMRTPVASTSRKKAANEPTPEEEELASIPSLQMRIKILQQRVSFLFQSKLKYFR